jgi:hypothetical protein
MAAVWRGYFHFHPALLVHPRLIFFFGVQNNER